MEDPTLRTYEVFALHVAKKGSLNESLDCGFWSHVTSVESLELSLWFVLTYASRERSGDVVG